ncbi:Bacterial Ig-like domain (group 2) [compost metagenome]
MSYKDKYIQRDAMYGNGVKGIRRNKTKQWINDSFADSPNCFEVTSWENQSSYSLIITDNSDILDVKDYVAPMNSPIQCGDTIVWNEQLWFVSHYDEIGGTYKGGRLKNVGSTLKWIDNKGEIKEYPFIFNAELLSNFGIEDGKVISVAADRRNLAIKKDEISKKIRLGQRFIFDDAAWKIISINRLNPLIEIILQSDTFTPNDNLELRIADYVKPNYKIILNETSISLTEGSTYQLSPKVLNNGIEVLFPTLSYESSDETLCIVDENGLITGVTSGTAVITISYKDVEIKINIQVEQVQSHNYSAVITGDSTITKGRTKTYTCNFYDNGSLIAMDGLFRLTDINGNATSIATITSQGNNSCVVRGDSLGYVLLIVEDVNGLVRTEKTIQIKSAI